MNDAIHHCSLDLTLKQPVSCALWVQTCLNNETPTQGVSNEDLTEIASVSMQQETSA